MHWLAPFFYMEAQFGPCFGQHSKPAENRFTEETTPSCIYLGEGKKSDYHFGYTNLDTPTPYEE